MNARVIRSYQKVRNSEEDENRNKPVLQHSPASRTFSQKSTLHLSNDFFHTSYVDILLADKVK